MADSHRDRPMRWAARREDGLRRLSALTVGVALASAVATGVLVVAAQHASDKGGASTGSGASSSQDGLRGPSGAPVPAQEPPVGLSSGS